MHAKKGMLFSVRSVFSALDQGKVLFSSYALPLSMWPQTLEIDVIHVNFFLAGGTVGEAQEELAYSIVYLLQKLKTLKIWLTTKTNINFTVVPVVNYVTN